MRGEWWKACLSHKSHESYRACRAVGLAKADPIRCPLITPLFSHVSPITSHSFQPLKLETLSQ